MKLPEIYKNKIDQNIRNSQTTFVSKTKEENNVLDKLPVSVYIETKTKKYMARIIGKTDNYIVTSNRDVINIKDIISIKEA